jgi:hypothetical protein
MAVKYLTADNFEQGKATPIEIKCGHATCVSYMHGLLVMHCDKTLLYDGDCNFSVCFRLQREFTEQLHQLAGNNPQNQIRYGCKACTEERGLEAYAVTLLFYSGMLTATCATCGKNVIKVELAKREDIN